jgi:hypothetical protein
MWLSNKLQLLSDEAMFHGRTCYVLSTCVVESDVPAPLPAMESSTIAMCSLSFAALTATVALRPV